LILIVGLNISIMEEGDIQLGFVEKTDPTWFEPRFFPSKAGGMPAWINPQHLPSPEVLQCASCSEPMCLLAQMYAPLASTDDAFHRMLYVFCCRRGACLKKSKKSFLVLRSQLPEENPFFEPSEEDLADLDVPPVEDLDSEHAIYRQTHAAPLCHVCGQPGNKKCGGCKIARYCSPSHQQLHWKLGKHAAQCGTMKEAASSTTPEASSATQFWKDESNPILFNEYEIITEDESKAKASRNAEVEEKQKTMLAKYYEELEEEKKSGEIDQTEFKEEDMPKNQHDETFVKFQTAIDVDGSQVLRYTTSASAEPLWMTSQGILALTDVPKCALCGSARIFELQILPQIIYQLDLKRNNVSGDPNDEIDFGTLVIYTCKNSCHVDPSKSNRYSSGAYAVEYLFQQRYE
jgi:pre-rRNA-processing protein TSR4